MAEAAELAAEQAAIVADARARIVVFEAKIADLNKKRAAAIQLKTEAINAINVEKDAAIKTLEDRIQAQNDRIYNLIESV
ncbi:hypothetical protein M0R72_12185 [Candidatus Pacearchaeota archaeon]|nr:hypothetical protein [Candidatus Pacearchaeota archaeon]